MSTEDQDDNMEMGPTGGEVDNPRGPGNDTNPSVPSGVDMIEICPHLPPRSTSVIVSITGDRSSPEEAHQTDNDGLSSRSATVSPSFGGPTESPLLNQRLAAKHLQVRQTLSEPSKAKLHRPKQHRMSPIPKRHEVSKTLSMSVLDGNATVPGWLSVDNPNSPTAMDSANSSNESLNIDGKTSSQHDMPSLSNLTINKLPQSSLTGSPLQMSPAWILPSISTAAAGGVGQLQAVTMPTQEQIEALQQKQIEMLSLIEQQKQFAAAAAAATTSGGKPPELFQFPIAIWPTAVGSNQLLTSSPLTSSVTVPTGTTSAISSVASPTPSLSSLDSGFQSLTPPTENIAQHRPLGTSQSAPHGLKEPMTNEQYETLLRQFQLQHQSLVVQQQQMYQHYLEQQQRVVQQAVLEKKRFEEQQRQLAGMHLEQQQQLQRQQQLLRQMQEQQLLQLQRQQQLLLLQTLGVQQQHQASLQLKPKPAVHRVVNKAETLSLPYTSVHGSSSIDGEGLAASHTSIHRSLSANSSVDSLGSNNGQNSPVAMAATAQDMKSPGVAGSGTGLVYDTMMLKHNCCCGSSHPEHPGRLQSIWARLHETGIVQRSTRLRARKASLAELQCVHSENHVRLYGRPNKLKTSQDKKDMAGMRAFVQMSCGGAGVDTDTYWNDQHTSNAARMAVGSVIELADKIVNGDIQNGFALIRPPGHHSLQNQAMAFCYFNNIALAAKAMIAKNKKVAIVDWDIHHGNGTQQIFYDNPAVLFISLHRYDNGTFFPGTGRPEEVGSGGGTGYNVNIAFSGKQSFQGVTTSNFGDPEYLAAFRSVVIPILRSHNPDIILVSAGFNATNGHPPTLGGYSVTPKCYAHLTRMLMNCGNGRVAIALEGGFELMSLCESAEACMRALLFENLPPLDAASLTRGPQPTAVASIEKTIACQKPYWSCLLQSVPILNMSHAEAERCDETVAALASLSMSGSKGGMKSPITS